MVAEARKEKYIKNVYKNGGGGRNSVNENDRRRRVRKSFTCGGSHTMDLPSGCLPFIIVMQKNIFFSLRLLILQEYFQTFV